MTDQTAFEYRDIHGDVFQARPTVTSDGPRVALEANLSIPVFVPLDRVEEVVAGIRAAARQTAGQPAADEGHRPPCVDGDHCGEAAHCPPAVSASYARLQAAATKTNREMAAATLRAYKRIHQLASTATGPIDPSEILDALKDPEPDPARLLAALNDGTPAAGLAAPTNHNTACGCGEPGTRGTVHRPGLPCYQVEAPIEARRPDTMWLVMRRGDTDWVSASTHYDDRDRALDCLNNRREQFPSSEHRLVRETTTWTVEETP